MAFFNFGKRKDGGNKKSAAKKKRTKSKSGKKQRLISIKNLHLNPTIEDGLYKTLAEGVSNPDEPYISIVTIDDEQFIYELALTDKLIHENGFDKGEPNIISQIKTGLALTGKHGNSVPKGLVNGSFFFDLDPEEGTEAQIVFVPTVSTLRRLEDLGGEDAKYQLVIIPADIDADNYDEYYQEGLINSPLQDDDGSGNRLVTIDEFKSLAEEGAGSPDLQENEGVVEDLDDDVPPEPDDDIPPEPNDDDFMSSGDDLTDDNDNLTSGNDDLMSSDDDLLGNDDNLASDNDDLMSSDDDNLASDNDDLMSSDDDLLGDNDNLTSNNDDLMSSDDDLDLDKLDDDDELTAPAGPAQNDPLASNDDDLKLDTDDNLDLPGNEDDDDGLGGFLDDEDDDDEFVGYDGQAEQGPTADDELSSKQDDFAVADSNEPEEVPDEEETKSDDDLGLDDDDESTDDMFDSILNDKNDDEPFDDEPSEDEADNSEDEPVEDEADDSEDEPSEDETDNSEDEADDSEDEPSEDETENEQAETDSNTEPAEAGTDKPKDAKKSSDDDGEGDSESKPTAKDLGYVDINKQNLDSFIRQNIIQLDNALDGLDARLFPIDAKYDNQSLIGYKTMYNGLLESQAKREKELIRTKFKHQLTQLLDPYVNHTGFSNNFPKIDAAFQAKLFDPVDIDTEKAAGQMQIEDRYKELHQKLIDDAIAKAEDDYANNYEPVKAQELEESSKAIDAGRRQKYDQAVDRVLNKAFYLNEAELSKEAQKITSRFIANDVAEANFELTNKAISYSEEMMRYMQFDKMIDARMGSTQKVDDSVMRQTIEDLQNRLNRQMEENKDSEKKIAALQSEINKAKTEPKPAVSAPAAKPEPVLDDSDDKVQSVVHDELKTGNELLAQLKQAMAKDGRKKPAKEIIKAAELDDEPVNAPEK